MILLGDCRAILPTLDAGSVRCCVTSPPYWGLRDYGVDGQIGLEKTPEAYVAEMVGVFREVRRVLADDGTLWLNLGDSYTGSGKGGNPIEGKQATNKGSQTIGVLYGDLDHINIVRTTENNVSRDWTSEQGIAPKNLVGIPWRVAFALQADGWYLRSDIIWHKPNPMPESVTDRPTKAHEYVFLLSKRERYYYDAGAIREAHQTNSLARTLNPNDSYGKNPDGDGNGELSTLPFGAHPDGRNARTVWTIPTQPTPDAHFATFPEALAERCILAGSAQGDTVLDPFFGSGTVGKVAERLGRKWIGIELNEKYVEIGKRKTAQRGIFA